jgi:hypothetical protein
VLNNRNKKQSQFIYLYEENDILACGWRAIFLILMKKLQKSSKEPFEIQECALPLGIA